MQLWRTGTSRYAQRNVHTTATVANGWTGTNLARPTGDTTGAWRYLRGPPPRRRGMFVLTGGRDRDGGCVSRRWGHQKRHHYTTRTCYGLCTYKNTHTHNVRSTATRGAEHLNDRDQRSGEDWRMAVLFFIVFLSHSVGRCTARALCRRPPAHYWKRRNMRVVGRRRYRFYRSRESNSCAWARPAPTLRKNLKNGRTYRPLTGLYRPTLFHFVFTKKMLSPEHHQPINSHARRPVIYIDVFVICGSVDVRLGIHRKVVRQPAGNGKFFN